MVQDKVVMIPICSFSIRGRENQLFSKERKKIQGQCYSVHIKRIKVITPTALTCSNNKLNENVYPTFGWWQSYFIASDYAFLSIPIYLDKAICVVQKKKRAIYI